MRTIKPNYIPIQSTAIPMPSVAPTLKHYIEIRLAKDNVYDVWVDGAWTFSRTSYQNVLTELEKLFTIFDPPT